MGEARPLAAPEGRTVLEEATAFLRDALGSTDGPVRAARIQEAAREAGISDASLRRAKAALDVRSSKGHDGSWSWSLPNDGAADDGAHAEGDERLERLPPGPAGAPEATADGRLDREIADLDREAREALDRLADKREEQQARVKETDLAAERQRERAEEARRKAEAEAAERERARRVRRADELGARRLALEQRAEAEAAALVATIGELVELDPAHERALRAAYGKVPPQRYGRSFSGSIFAWFSGRFHGVVPGFPFYAAAEKGVPLPELDALTPPPAAPPSSGPASEAGA